MELIGLLYEYIYMQYEYILSSVHYAFAYAPNQCNKSRSGIWIMPAEKNNVSLTGRGKPVGKESAND